MPEAVAADDGTEPDRKTTAPGSDRQSPPEENMSGNQSARLHTLLRETRKEPTSIEVFFVLYGKAQTIFYAAVKGYVKLRQIRKMRTPLYVNERS